MHTPIYCQLLSHFNNVSVCSESIVFSMIVHVPLLMRVITQKEALQDTDVQIWAVQLIHKPSTKVFVVIVYAFFCAFIRPVSMF